MDSPGSFPAEMGSSTFSADPIAYELAASGHNNNETDDADGGGAALEDLFAHLRPAGTSSSGTSRRTGATLEKKIVIAVFGMTGTGKSTFISKLTGQNVEIGHGLQSCTTHFESRAAQMSLTGAS